MILHTTPKSFSSNQTNLVLICFELKKRKRKEKKIFGSPKVKFFAKGRKKHNEQNLQGKNVKKRSRIQGHLGIPATDKTWHFLNVELCAGVYLYAYMCEYVRVCCICLLVDLFVCLCVCYAHVLCILVRFCAYVFVCVYIPICNFI